MEAREFRIDNFLEANIKDDYDGIQKWKTIKVTGVESNIGFKENEPEKVFFIEPDIATFNLFRKYSKLEKECLRGIPLTEEWHNKFGVKKNGFNGFEYFVSDRQLISFSGDYVYLRDLNRKSVSPQDDICVLWNNDLKKRDMYVHEFQNLYYALKGEELTIKQ